MRRLETRKQNAANAEAAKATAKVSRRHSATETSSSMKAAALGSLTKQSSIKEENDASGGENKPARSGTAASKMFGAADGTENKDSNSDTTSADDVAAAAAAALETRSSPKPGGKKNLAGTSGASLAESSSSNRRQSAFT